jgi:hypothetical protein
MHATSSSWPNAYMQAVLEIFMHTANNCWLDACTQSVSAGLTHALQSVTVGQLHARNQ